MSAGTMASERADSPSAGAAPSSGPRQLPAVGALVALVVLAAVLRFYRLGHQGFWFDEANTTLLVHFSPGKMIGLIPQTESTPPLYYCVAWVWARVFGYGEAGLRSLSAVAGVLSVPAVYGAARILLGERVALLAAALTATNPFLIWYSQEARSYSLLVLLTSTALLAFAWARARPTVGRLALWTGASALALATHYYAVLAIVPQAVWLLASHRRRREVQVAVGVVALCGLALVPLAIGQNGTGNANWITHFSLAERLSQVFPQFLIGTGAPAYGVLEPLAAAAVAIGLALLALRTAPGVRRAGLGVGALALGGLLLSLVLALGGADDVLTRNLLGLWVPGAIAVATGLAAGRPRLLGLAAAAALCAIGVAAAAGVAFDRSLQRPDWRGVARVLAPRPASGSGGRVILIQHYRDLLPLSLYLPGLQFWRAGESRTVAELDVVSIAAHGQVACWWGAACNLIPSQMQGSYPIRGFRELWVRHIYQFTIMRLAASRPTVVSRREISHALSTTTLRRDDLLFQR